MWYWSCATLTKSWSIRWLTFSVSLSLSLPLTHSSRLIYTHNSHQCRKWTLYRPAGWYGSAPSLCSAPSLLLPLVWEGCRRPPDETASDYPFAWIVPWWHWRIQPLTTKTDARVAKSLAVRLPTNQLQYQHMAGNGPNINCWIYIREAHRAGSLKTIFISLLPAS